MDLILASQSPRRRALLEQFGLTFQVQVLPVQEVSSGPPLAVAQANAVAKARPVSQGNPTALVLGADTIVVLDIPFWANPGTGRMPGRQGFCGREHGHHGGPAHVKSGCSAKPLGTVSPAHRR